MRIKLQTLRIARGYSQAAFSAAVGISRSHYSQIETGEKDPSLKVGIRIKHTLAYPDDDIFFNETRPVSRR
ncbi:MAG: helix-turn-helix domain-containing protein [Clostridia bacterium]|nr:helix-turn-helix domain-containing protein [Oscillospiraceae bacterium]MBQ3551646.1 helix-turn-helix domain-containing protein [Clostridia bacterium]